MKNEVARNGDLFFCTHDKEWTPVKRPRGFYIKII